MDFNSRPDLPDSLKLGNIVQMATGHPVLFNALKHSPCHPSCFQWPLDSPHPGMLLRSSCNWRHHSATTLQHLSMPPLGSHTHIPKFPSLETQKKKRSIKDVFKGSSSALSLNGENNGYSLVDISIDDGDDNAGSRELRRMFANPKIHDAFLGGGDYSALVFPNGYFGLGFRRLKSDGDKISSYGHSGVGGSTGFCDIEHDFSIAITVNKMSLGGVSRRIIQLVCSELNVPVPDEFSETGRKGPDMQIYRPG